MGWGVWWGACVKVYTWELVCGFPDIVRSSWRDVPLVLRVPFVIVLILVTVALIPVTGFVDILALIWEGFE